jgi:hypothetical protein
MRNKRKADHSQVRSPTKRNSDDDTVSGLTLPKRSRGRQSAEAVIKYEAELDAWCDIIKRMYDERAEDVDNFDVSSRGWCYLLEEHGLFKDEFDKAQNLINDCRKSGHLPLDVCCEDDRRAADNLEYLDDPDPKARAAEIVDEINQAEQDYFPQSFWEGQDTYVQMLVEKIDLKNLFTSVCEPFRIPIWNGGGWGDLNSRVAAIQRFKHWEREGKRIVLLYCGDLDPGGLRISDAIRKNLADMSHAVVNSRPLNWSPDNLIIDRFGIDKDFIRQHRMSWIENLRTSRGEYALDDRRHPDHKLGYVQDYLAEYGARKVEATAMVVPRIVPHARALCRKAILKYLRANAPDQYASSLELPRKRVKAEIKRLLRTA